jgi:hypothetical protein
MTPEKDSKSRTSVAISLFLAAAALFNFPIISLFNTKSLFFGIPLLYLYLFSAWGGIILLVFLQSGTESSRNRKP